MDVTAQTWRVGELAARTGLSVRTLHHYDAIGLLVPAARSEAGHRRYDAADVRRLYRVLALRQLGLPLERIAAVLEGEDGDPLETVRRHLADVDAELARIGRLRSTLAAIVVACEADEQPSPEAFLTAIEEMTMRSRYFTPDQQEQLARRREALGDAAIEDYPAPVGRADRRGRRPARRRSRPGERGRAGAGSALAVADRGVHGRRSLDQALAQRDVRAGGRAGGLARSDPRPGADGVHAARVRGRREPGLSPGPRAERR
jgi:DNA-binding transcriptional MerR regulator